MKLAEAGRSKRERVAQTRPNQFGDQAENKKPNGKPHTVLPYATTRLRPSGFAGHRRRSSGAGRNRSQQAALRSRPRATPSRPPHPVTPRIVTTRTPLFMRRDRWRGQDFRWMKSGLFFARGLDDPNHVELAGEIGFCARVIWRDVWTRDRAVDGRKRRLICPTGSNCRHSGACEARARNPFHHTACGPMDSGLAPRRAPE